MEITGNVLFNSRRLKTSDRRQLVSYVAQDTALAGEFTVRETLFFYAQMYFGVYSSTRHAMAEKIEDVILSVGLKSCEHVRVGSLFFRGLSGGQKKRLAIAIELISSPSVLICDGEFLTKSHHRKLTRSFSHAQSPPRGLILIRPWALLKR